MELYTLITMMWFLINGLIVMGLVINGHLPPKQDAPRPTTAVYVTYVAIYLSVALWGAIVL